MSLPAMVLSAGLGTRLRPLTDVRAKPAIPVAGIPMIRRILSWLTSHGVRDVVVNLHHRPESISAVVGDGPLIVTILEELGFRPWFRYQKYREEFSIGDVIVAVDETPVGTFVELEGGDRGIAETAEALGCGPGEYLLDSYRSLFCEHCRQRGIAVTNMVFEENNNENW